MLVSYRGYCWKPRKPSAGRTCSPPSFEVSTPKCLLWKYQPARCDIVY
jgi:hypothetical protein